MTRIKINNTMELGKSTEDSNMANFPFPQSYEDIDWLLQQINEGETDDDLFACNEVKNGRTYSIYGTKVFEFLPKQTEKARNKFKVIADILSAMGLDAGDKEGNTLVQYTINTEEELVKFIEVMKIQKRCFFRQLVTETFSCCNDFMQCSEAEACVHQNDRFYNGCGYRVNLEQGKIFYGSKRNID